MPMKQTENCGKRTGRETWAAAGGRVSPGKVVVPTVSSARSRTVTGFGEKGTGCPPKGTLLQSGVGKNLTSKVSKE